MAKKQTEKDGNTPCVCREYTKDLRVSQLHVLMQTITLNMLTIGIQDETVVSAWFLVLSHLLEYNAQPP